MNANERRIALLAQKEQLRAYCRMKLDSDDDYHGVADAAMDIREIDARLSELDRLTPLPRVESTWTSATGPRHGAACACPACIRLDPVVS
jgi:hypothetical protein